MSVLEPSTFCMTLSSDDPTVSFSGPQQNARTSYTVNLTSLIPRVPERSQWAISLSSLIVWANPSWFFTPASDIFLNVSLVQQSITGSRVTQTLYIIPINSLLGGTTAQKLLKPFEVKALSQSTVSELRYQTRVTITLANSNGAPLAPSPIYAANPLSEYVTRVTLMFQRMS